MSNSQEGSGLRHWAPRIAAAVLVPVLFIGVIEIALRLFGVGFSTNVTVPCSIQGHPGSCYNLFFAAPFFPPGMIKTPEVYAIPDQKPQGTYRIVVLGESAAMGDPDPAYSFSRYLEVMLRERYPSMKFEVVNTGIVAIDSHVLLPIAKDLAKHNTDLFIIYAGNNEVVGPYGPGTALTSSAMSLPVIRASIFARSTRIGQLLTRMTSHKRQWGGMEMFMDKQVRANSPLMGRTYSNFESNLRNTIAVAHKSGARVIVSTVATSLSDCAPFASMHRANLSQESLRNWTTLVQQGSELENNRDYAAALKTYLSALAIDGEYAELEFRIARCAEMLGDYRAAKEHFVRARDLDTLRFRADSRINDINRSVASSAAGAELVDSDAALAKESPDGIVGNQFVYEHVHMTPRGNYLIARALLLQITSKMAAPATGNDEVLTQERCERLLALTEHDRSRMAAEMLQRLEKPPFVTQLNHSEQELRLSLKTASSETPDETLSQYEWALAQKPDDRILHFNLGLFLYEYNPRAAVDQFRMARPWDDFPVFTPDGQMIQ
jgi:tetratricopeptide (TPR) repeat protein